MREERPAAGGAARKERRAAGGAARKEWPAAGDAARKERRAGVVAPYTKIRADDIRPYKCPRRAAGAPFCEVAQDGFRKIPQNREKTLGNRKKVLDFLYSPVVQ